MSNSNSRVTLPIPGLLGIAFVVLKLCGVIDWSWWWVTAPWWVVAVVIGFIFATAFVVVAVEESKKGKA